MSRIIYYFGQGSKKPTGGYYVLNQHVKWLRQAKINSCILVDLQFAPSFERPSLDVPILLPNDPIYEDDILVFPEPDLRPVNRLRQKARIWICCQNHYYIFNTAEDSTTWNKLGVEGVISTSSTIKRFINRHFPDLRNIEVRCSVDQMFFDKFQMVRDTPVSVAFMPRKMPNEAKFVKYSFEKRYGSIPIRWEEIDRMDRKEVALKLSNASIFLFLNRIEGLGLPGREAMATGAVVVGFKGGGVCDYATAENGYWSDPDDFDGIIDNLALAVQLILRGSSSLDAMIRAGATTAIQYSESIAAKRLVEAWSSVL